MAKEEAAFYLPLNVASQDHRIQARFWLSKEAPDHMNPAAPGDGEGRLYQIIDKISLAAKKLEGSRTLIIARLTAWYYGASGREGDKPRLFVCLGDPFGLITVSGSSPDSSPPAAGGLLMKCRGKWSSHTATGAQLIIWRSTSGAPLGSWAPQAYAPRLSRVRTPSSSSAFPRTSRPRPRFVGF